MPWSLILPEDYTPLFGSIMKAAKQVDNPWVGYCVQYAFLQTGPDPSQPCIIEKLHVANTPCGSLVPGGAYTCEIVDPAAELDRKAKRNEYLAQYPGLMLQAPACRSIAAGLRQLRNSSFPSPVLYSRDSLTKTLQTAMMGKRGTGCMACARYTSLFGTAQATAFSSWACLARGHPPCYQVLTCCMHACDHSAHLPHVYNWTNQSTHQHY